MADDELERLRRHHESLLQEYGELMRTQVRHDERINKGSEERGEIRAAMEKMELELLAAIGRSEQRQRDLVTSVKASCDKGWADMATWVANFERDQKVARDRADDRAYTAKWQGRAMAVGVASAVIAALGVIVALVALLLGAFG